VSKLRILAVFPLPWDPRLGASRVWIELAEQWKKAGHSFEKFCLSDAFPEPTSSRPLSALRQMLFPARAADYIRRNASRFDVIDSLIGSLPYSKKQLSFEGLLVGRSAGFHRSYQEFRVFSEQRWPDQPRARLGGRLFYDFLNHRSYQSSERALPFCDLLILLNEDEARRVTHEHVVVRTPGLTDSQRAAFTQAIQPADVRLKRKQICFVGMWSLRKGSHDWKGIIHWVRKSIPGAQFLFLGTGVDDATVINDLGVTDTRGIRCVSTYNPVELPTLLGPCAVGIFPSYIEGFGIGVIEQLACGIPTVAYDVPGPQHIFGANKQFLVSAGDTSAIAARAVEFLQASETEYAALSAKCCQIAGQFRWEQIAADTIRDYETALARINSQTPASPASTVTI
jgi:glycosyltransferase involved in cell wall biosynthesis